MARAKEITAKQDRYAEADVARIAASVDLTKHAAWREVRTVLAYLWGNDSGFIAKQFTDSVIGEATGRGTQNLTNFYIDDRAWGHPVRTSSYGKSIGVRQVVAAIKSLRESLSRRTNMAKRRRNNIKRNTHLAVGTAVTYKGHAAKVTKQHLSDRYTIKFVAGSSMTVAGKTLKRANPYLAFEAHGGQKSPTTFFAHTTRQLKAKTGTGSYRRGGKKLKGRGRGQVLSESPSGYQQIGRGPRHALTRAQQNAKLRAAWKALAPSKKKQILARLRKGRK